MLQKTVIPSLREANVSIRLVGNQDPAVIAPAFEALLRDGRARGHGARDHAALGGARPD